jgi:putative transposase/transposase-like zinc-binding protein
MRQVSLEVGDVFRDYAAEYLEAFGDVTSSDQRRVLRDLMRCRTAALGGHVEECDQCGHRVISYNSCRNRHCPKCQGAARAAWLAKQAEDVLEVGYYHIVFTLPDPLGPVALQNRRLVYGTLFQAAAQTLIQVAADPKHLGAQIGLLAVLHTWGQTMILHPHIHCVVPGGGLTPDGTRWVSCRPGFFLPVRILSRMFRGKFLAMLRDSHDRGKLSFHGQQQALANPSTFRRWCHELRETEWVIYAKRPFGGPQQVLKYLARYTHRVAISNQRLVKMEQGQVHFQWKDYAHDHAQKVMALDAVEFMRRFLLHVLPSGFVHIRHYGFLANRCREEKLPQCRRLIAAYRGEPLEGPMSSKSSDAEVPPASEVTPRDAEDRHRCPACGQGQLIIIELCSPQGPSKIMEGEPATFSTADTS